MPHLPRPLAALAAAGFATGVSAAPTGAAKDGAAAPRLAFVLLEDAAMPRAAAVLAALRAIAPPGELDAAASSSWTSENAVYTLGDDGLLGIGLMPGPVPKQEAEWHAERSLAAVQGGWKLPPHRAHLAVFWKAAPQVPARLAVKRFTWLLAAVTEAAKGVAVYWADAGATHPGRYFTEVARHGPDLLITLWSGVSVASDRGDPNRMSLVSLGMAQLGLPDLELSVPRSIEKADALGVLYRFLSYVLERGAPIPDGDTIGRTEQERLKVRYVPSPVAPDAKVWRVELPERAPPRSAPR